jgi:hypothetical protein
MIEIAKPKFHLGKLVSTPGALAALTEAGQSPTEFVSRHVVGDWGDCDQHDQQANEDALRDGDRLFSVYKTAKGVKIWIGPRNISTIRRIIFEKTLRLGPIRLTCQTTAALFSFDIPKNSSESRSIAVIGVHRTGLLSRRLHRLPGNGLKLLGLAVRQAANSSRKSFGALAEDSCIKNARP